MEPYNPNPDHWVRAALYTATWAPIGLFEPLWQDYAVTLF